MGQKLEQLKGSGIFVGAATAETSFCFVPSIPEEKPNCRSLRTSGDIHAPSKLAGFLLGMGAD